MAIAKIAARYASRETLNSCCTQGKKHHFRRHWTRMCRRESIRGLIADSHWHRLYIRFWNAHSRSNPTKADTLYLSDKKLLESSHLNRSHSVIIYLHGFSERVPGGPGQSSQELRDGNCLSHAATKFIWSHLQPNNDREFNTHFVQIEAQLFWVRICFNLIASMSCINQSMLFVENKII